jgi:Zn-dependent protease
VIQKINLETVVLKFFALLVALTTSTAAKVILAVKLGDRSYELKRRATFNPLVHIDPLGTLIFPLSLLLFFPGVGIIFGWAKPTFIRLPFKKSWKRDLILLSFMAPVFNFFVAFCSSFVNHLMHYEYVSFGNIEAMIRPLTGALFSVNIALGFFHLLPFPRSDIWNLITAFLKPDRAAQLQNLSLYVWFFLMFVLFAGGFLKVLMIIATMVDTLARLPFLLLQG